MTVGARVQSHFDPKRYLKQHVAEILAASEAILEQHGSTPWREEGGEALTSALAKLHDLGKGSAAFQAYIAAPERWRGRPHDKAHTLLSLVLSTLWAQSEAWPSERMIAMALAVRGHHGRQPADEASLVEALVNDAPCEALCAQLPTVDRAALAQETGITLPSPDADNPFSEVRRAQRALRRALDSFRELPLDARARSRFRARAAYSVLLEADKAFLAIETSVIKGYLHRARPSIPAKLVDEHCASLPKTPMDALRAAALSAAADGFARHNDEARLTLTLPTGAGKTLVAARWALSERENDAAAPIDAPMVVIALPMLSIVDQTEKVYRSLLGARREDDGDVLMPYHSLSERVYDSELPGNTADFFLDTWRSEVVVTTFDQLLLAMYSDKAKHAMRYHRLLNARIIIDEVQCIPPVLWTAVREGLLALTKLGRTKVLAMSATPSLCLEGAATEVLDDPAALYAPLNRYELRLEHEAPLHFEAFVTKVVGFCTQKQERNEGTLVTVNMRATAQETFARLATAGLDPLLLSGDMTPEHRLSVIEALKGDPARVVVSTQCVEAGVDLDMHHVIRDFAPLDALVQIAGRCNRHGRRTEAGTVTVVSLRDPQRRDNSAIIYDEILRQCTREVLRGREVVAERDVLELCRAYFEQVKARKALGRDEFKRWTRLDEALDVRALLRDGEAARRAVVVTERDPGLAAAITGALAVRGRWERRAALRALAARVARNTVSVSEKVFADLKTRAIDPGGAWSELLPGQYDPRRGVDSRTQP